MIFRYYKLNVNIENDLYSIIKRNILVYMNLMCKQIFINNSEQNIKYLVDTYKKQVKNIKKIVMRAYNNVRRWLKQDYPNLSLRDLTEDNIYIFPTKQYPDRAGFCNINTTNNSANIHLSQATIDNSQTYMEKVIYHELIHAIKGQADMATEIYNNSSPKLTHNEYQAIAHNDDIWDQGMDTVRKHTHLDARGYDTNKDITHASIMLRQLKQPHEATLVCYNCGYFTVYRTWNKDCELAKEGNFTCPKCHKNDVKLISPGPGEKELINDAFAHIHYQVAEQMPYMPVDKNRLQKRKEYQDKVNNYEFLKEMRMQAFKNVNDTYIMQFLKKYDFDKSSINNTTLDEILGNIIPDMCYDIFNKTRYNYKQQCSIKQMSYDDFISSNEYSIISELIYEFVKQQVNKLILE